MPHRPACRIQSPDKGGRISPQGGRSRLGGRKRKVASPDNPPSLNPRFPSPGRHRCRDEHPDPPFPKIALSVFARFPITTEAKLSAYSPQSDTRRAPAQKDRPLPPLGLRSPSPHTREPDGFLSPFLLPSKRLCPCDCGLRTSSGAQLNCQLSPTPSPVADSFSRSRGLR